MLAVGQRYLCGPALEQTSVRTLWREAFDLVQDFQGAFHFVKAVKLTLDRLSRLGGFASACEFSEVKQFRLHFPDRHKLCAQSFQMMVEAEAAAQGSVDKQEFCIQFG
jgi:hypothetical protein